MPGLFPERPKTRSYDPLLTNFEISFPLHFQSFRVPRIGILPAPMLPSNRRYACTTKIPRPPRPPRLAQPGVPLIPVGAQSSPNHTCGACARFDSFASQNFPPSPQPKVDQWFTAHEKHGQLFSFASQRPRPRLAPPPGSV